MRQTDTAASLLRSIWREAAWVVTGEAVGAVGALVSVRLLTSALSPAEYGELALGLTVASLVSQTVLGPLANAGERFFATARERSRLSDMLRALRTLVWWASAFAVAIGAFSVVVLTAAGYPQWAALAFAGFAFALLSGWERILDALQNAARARAVVAWHQALRQWLRPMVAVVLVASTTSSGTVALFGFSLASVGVLTSQLLIAKRKFVAPIGMSSGSSTRREQSRLLRYALPFSAWGVFLWLQLSSGRWALQILDTSDAVGLYAVLVQVGVYPLTLAAGIFSQLFAPIIFARVGDGTNPEHLRSGFRLTVTVILGFIALTVFAIALSIVFHQTLFSILVAPAYHSASTILPLVLAAGGAFNVGQLLCLMPMAAGDTKALFVPKLSMAVVCVPLYFSGAALAGVEGVVLANLITAMLYALWMVAVAARVLRPVHANRVP